MDHFSLGGNFHSYRNFHYIFLAHSYCDFLKINLSTDISKQRISRRTVNVDMTSDRFEQVRIILTWFENQQNNVFILKFKTTYENTPDILFFSAIRQTTG